MSSAKKKRCYAVAVGRQCGVFHTWQETEASVTGYPNALYKGAAYTLFYTVSTLQFSLFPLNDGIVVMSYRFCDTVRGAIVPRQPSNES